MRDSDREHLHRYDLVSTARRTVYIRIARNKEFRELVHELARRICPASYELWAVRKSSK